MSANEITAQAVLHVIQNWWKREGQKLQRGLRFSEIAAQLGYEGQGAGSTTCTIDRELQRLRRGGRIQYVAGTWRPT